MSIYIYSLLCKTVLGLACLEFKFFICVGFLFLVCELCWYVCYTFGESRFRIVFHLKKEAVCVRNVVYVSSTCDEKKQFL